MLNLPNFNIIDMEESVDDYRFFVEALYSPPFYCLNVVLSQTYTFSYMNVLKKYNLIKPD
jgi:hypothetical protein